MSNSVIMTTENHIESLKLLDESNSNISESDTTNYVRLPRRKVKTKRKPRSDNVPRNRAKQFCSFLTLLKVLGILIIAIIFCILGFLVFNLYEKIDHLTLQLQSVESSPKKFPEEFHSIHLQLKNLDEINSVLKENITSVSIHITTLNREVQKILSMTDSLSKSIAAAPQLEALPKKVVSLQQSVATMGSKLTSLETTVKEIKEKSGDENKQYLQSIQELQFQVSGLQNKSYLLNDNLEQLQIFCKNSSKFSQSTFEAFQEELKQLISSTYDNSSFTGCSLCNNSAQAKIKELLNNLTKIYHALLIKFLEYQDENGKDLNKNLIKMELVKALEASINESLEKLEENNLHRLQTLQNDTDTLKQQIFHLEEEIHQIKCSNSSADESVESYLGTNSSVLSSQNITGNE